MSQHKPTYTQEPCVPFVFYEESQTLVKDENITKLLDFLLYYIIPDNNPRLKLVLICFSCGLDVGKILGCENTQRDISKKLNINHRQFSNMLISVCEEFNITPINNSHIRPPASYKKNGGITSHK